MDFIDRRYRSKKDRKATMPPKSRERHGPWIGADRNIIILGVASLQNIAYVEVTHGPARPLLWKCELFFGKLLIFDGSVNYFLGNCQLLMEM